MAATVEKGEGGGGLTEALVMRKRLYKFLIGFVVSVAVCIMLLIALIWSVTSKPDPPTEGFVRAASALTKNMNFSADPCENFYDYACGGWMRTNVIPDDRDDWSNFVILRQETSVTLYTVFSEKIKMKEHPVYEQKVLDMYTSCMVTTDMDDASTDLLNATASTIKNATSKDDAVTLTANTYTDFFLGTYVDADLTDPTIYTLFVHQSTYGLATRKQYLNETYIPLRELYKTYLSELLTELIGTGAGTSSVVNTTVENVMKFEICVANGMMRPDELRKVEDLSNHTTYENIDFGQTFFKRVMQSKVGATETVDKDTRVSYIEKFVKDVDTCIASELSDDDDFKSYLALRYLMRYAPYGKKQWRDIAWRYTSAVRGVDVKPARWKTCIDLTQSVLPFAVGRLFTDESFKQESRKSTMDMIEYIKNAFEDLLPDLAWMDDDTREKSVEKANEVDHKIGYPEWTINDTSLNAYLYDVELFSTDQIGNIMIVSVVAMHRDFRKMNGVVDKKKWFMSPAIVNAYYNPKGNEMVFPAAILQPPFFFASHPMYVNFGSIGVVIGHELTHGFDDNGRKYDKDGKKVDWWSKEVTDKFTEQTKCMIYQYGNYSIQGYPVNGLLTLGENIADNGGVKQSFNAYKQWVKKNGKEATLPGTTLTNEQAFFLSYAQIWCQKKTDKAYQTMTETDPHSPGPQRVEGPLINSKDFANAYNCKPGSRMSPLDDSTRCTVW